MRDGDFLLRAQDSSSDKLVGTPSYMSPEQLRGRPADPRNDLWSTAVRAAPITG